MARMTGFVFQDKYLDRLAKLSDQEVGRLVRALATYHATGEEQELKGRECGYYDFIKGDIDEIEQAYQKKCKNMKREQLPPIAPNCPQLPSTADNINININKKSCNSGNGDNAREELFDVDVDPLIIKVQRELNGLTDTHYDELDGFREELTDEVVSHAIDIAVANGIRNWSYVYKVLTSYVRDHVRSVGEAKAADEQFRKLKDMPAHNPVRSAGGPKPHVNPFMDMLKAGGMNDAQ